MKTFKYRTVLILFFLLSITTQIKAQYFLNKSLFEVKLSLKSKGIDYEQEKVEDGTLKLFYSIKDEYDEVTAIVFTFKPKQEDLHYCIKEEEYRPSCGLGEFASVASFYSTLRKKGYIDTQFELLGNPVLMNKGSESMVKNYYGFRFNHAGDDCQIVKSYFLNTDEFELK